MKRFILSSLFTALASSAIAGRYDAVVASARGASPLVRKALGQSLELQEKTAECLNNLRARLKDAAEEKCLEAKDIMAPIHQRFVADLETFGHLATAMEPLKPGIDITWGLKSHKMASAVKGASNLLHSESALGQFLSGGLIPGYDFTPPAPCAILGAGFYGSARGTHFKASLLSVLGHLNDQPSVVAAFDNGMADIDNCPFVHGTPVPNGLEQTLGASPYYVPDYFEGKPGFLTIHNGYTFGGHRGEPRYPRGKHFGPQDCSSWVASITGAAQPFTTLDQWGLYAHTQNPHSEKLSSFDAMSKSFSLISTLEDVKPGDIYVHRNFKEGGAPNGSGGHTAMVLGSDGKTVVTLGYNRNLLIPEQLEGFGVQAFPYESTPTRKVFFLRLQE